MITLQHVALFMLAAFDNSKKSFYAGLPWVLLPDAIRAYTKKRQMSHFERTPDKSDVSWMVFPDPMTLPNLNGENALDFISYHFPEEKYPACVVGEKTSIKVFDEHNYWHPFHKYLRIHLAQDVTFDRFIRNMILDVSRRFEDDYFVRTSCTHVNGAKARDIISSIEMAGFLHLAGRIFNKTGVMIDQKWFDREVYALLENSVYPEDLAETTIRYMKIPANINEKIHSLDFHYDGALPGMTIDYFEAIIDKMYAAAYLNTVREL